MKKTIIIISVSVVFIIGLLLAGAIYKGIKPISLGIHSPIMEKNGVALNGYDVVSYFKGNPLLGNKSYSTSWKELEWNFSSKENLDLFTASPDQYLPQFGGYCGKAISTGFTGPSNPEIWHIRDNKLYIFSGEDVKQEFIKSPDKMIEACSKKWSK